MVREVSISPAARPVNRNNLSTGLKKGSFINPKESKMLKLKAIDKEGQLPGSREKPGIGWVIHSEGSWIGAGLARTVHV